MPNGGAGAGPFKLRVAFFNATHPEVRYEIGLTSDCTYMFTSIYFNEFKPSFDGIPFP